MERVGMRLLFAASDLVDFVNCAHLATLGRLVADGNLAAAAPSAEERLVARKGDAHESAYIARLREQGVAVVEIARGFDFASRRVAAEATLAAMRAGAEAIHGATLIDLPAIGAGWVGVVDLLVRVPGPSTLGDYAYEVWDAKLARNAKPAAIVQMCVYAELLARVQGVLPQRVVAILGDGRTEAFQTADVMPYYRAAKERFLRNALEEPATYPEPVAHCARCRWSEACVSQRRADDHLSIVANVRRSQIVKLRAGGITTMAELACATDDDRPRKLERTTFARIRAQAALQVASQQNGGKPLYELIAPQEKCGFAKLPAPDPGDLYFDMEGDPFYEGGLEYLFGVAYQHDGERRFEGFTGHDRAAERRAFEAFVDFVVARRARHPNLHVYHYASYEATALRRLAGTHGTREREIDDFEREEVLVDLFEVVRQSLRASFESYSLKKIEHFYRGSRGDAVTSAIGSVVEYERYLETRDESIYEEIVKYNREDCLSTLDLHHWLLERKAEAEEKFGAPIPVAEPRAAKEQTEEDLDLEKLAAQLAGEIDSESATPDQYGRWLAAQLLRYHQREARPAWWAFFDRLEKTPEDLVDDAEALGELSVVDEPPEVAKRSLIYTLTFPPQEHKLKPGRVYDPALGFSRSAGDLLEVDEARGRLRLSRGKSYADVPLPRALCPGGPIGDGGQRKALERFARALLKDDCRTSFRAARDLLFANEPRLNGRAAGATIDDGETTPDKLADLTVALDESYLFVQGPPGAGKTWTGARAIVDLMTRGLRVGVASTSHKAIHNLLEEIERVAFERGVRFRGYKKCAKGSNSESEYRTLHGFIDNTDDTSLCAGEAGVQLIAGTAWLFSDERMSATIDVLAIDEAGQVSLADAIAMATSARNLILLGDPMQLAQVSQGQHPRGAEASVLAHLLGERITVAPERGLFLARSFRMHPAICAYISRLAYDGRLHADAPCQHRRIEAGAISGAGLRYLPVPHEGNVQFSTEEADAIADAVDELLGGTVIDERGRAKALDEGDILVVTPYNANVRRMRGVLDERGHAGVRVGTVDKFQGQQAAVVFFAMAVSRGEEVPRGVGFLFDRNRLNVAVSRAQALAVLVCAPTLLETPAADVEQMVTIGALCRFAQEASPLRNLARADPAQLALI